MIRVFKNDIIHIVTACLVRYCVYSARRGINITLHTVNLISTVQLSVILPTFNTVLFSLYQIVKNTKSNV